MHAALALLSILSARRSKQAALGQVDFGNTKAPIFPGANANQPLTGAIGSLGGMTGKPSDFHAASTTDVPKAFGDQSSPSQPNAVADAMKGANKMFGSSMGTASSPTSMDGSLKTSTTGVKGLGGVAEGSKVSGAPRSAAPFAFKQKNSHAVWAGYLFRV